MAATGRIVGPIALAELISLSQRVPELAGDFLSAEEVAPAGQYTRQAPICSDSRDAEELTQVLHGQYMARLTQAHGAVHHAALRDATLLGEGTVVTASGALLIDSCWEFFSQGGMPPGLTRSDDGRYHVPQSTVRQVDRPSLLVKRPFWPNYGHWIVDGASILATTSRLRLPPDCQIIIGQTDDPHMRAVMRDTFDRLAPGMTVVEQPSGETWRLAALHYVSPPHISPFTTHPLVLEALSSRLGGSAGTASDRRLYIARDPAWKRRLLNEDQLIEICRHHGFEVVRPEQHSLREQVALFQSAQCVVGVKGAALTNILFCASGTRVLVLSPSDWPDPFFWDLASQRGVAYGEMFGPVHRGDERQSMHAFEINPQRFAANLLALCEAPAPRPAVPAGAVGS